MEPSNHTIFLSGPAGLARLLAQDQTKQPVWAPEEMRAMWQHQLSAPIEADLSTVQSRGSSLLRRAPEAEPFLAKTFGQLLHHRQPPLPLLKLTKEFAKQTIQDAEDPQLKEIAAALYYTSYAAALVRCGERLGGMNEPELRGGFEWALGRTWMDEATKALMQEASEAL